MFLRLTMVREAAFYISVGATLVIGRKTPLFVILFFLISNLFDLFSSLWS